MDLRSWKNVLMKWIKACKFIDQNYITIEQTDLEAFFSVYTRHANVEKKTTPMRSNKLMKFLNDYYPGFNTRFDTHGLVISSDYVYVYTLLLHYACVHNPMAYFHKICKSLPTDLQQNLAVFFNQTMENPCLTRNRLNETIINVTKQMSYNHNYSDSAPNDCLSILGDIDGLATNVVCDDSINVCSSDVVSSTNGVLSSITPRKTSLYSTNGNNGAHDELLTPKTELLDKHTRDLLGLRAELETERFSNTVLEDELQEKKLIIHSLTQENKSIKEQLAKVKAKMNSDDEDTSQRTTSPNNFDHLKKRFSKEIENKEKQINETIEKVNDLQSEKLELEEKLKSTESHVHVCMEQIRELESKVTTLTESMKLKTDDFDCVVREKRELQQCLDETREAIKNKREVLNASSDFLDTSLSSGSINGTPETLASSVVDKQLWEKEIENNQMREELQSLQQIKHFLVKKLGKVIEDYARLHKLDLVEDLATLNALLCKYDEGELTNVIERCSQAIVEKSQKQDEELQEHLAYSNGLEMLNSNLTKMNAELNEEVKALQTSLNATIKSVEALQIERSDMVQGSFMREQQIKNLKESNHVLQDKLKKLGNKLENSKMDFSKQQNVQNNVIKSLKNKIKEQEDDLSNCKTKLYNLKLDNLTVHNDLKESYEKLSKRFELSCKDAEQQSIMEQKYKNEIMDLRAEIEKNEMSKQFMLSKISEKDVKISDLSIEVRELYLKKDKLDKLVTGKHDKLSSYMQKYNNYFDKINKIVEADNWDQALKNVDALVIGKRQMSQAIDSLQASNADLKKMLDLSNQSKTELQACFNELSGKLEEQKCDYEEKVAKLKDVQQLHENCIDKFYESVSTIVPSDKTPPAGSLNATFSDLGDIGNRLAAIHSILLDLLREKDKVYQEAKNDCDKKVTHMRKDVERIIEAKKQELFGKEAELKKNESKLKDTLQHLEALNEQQQKEHSSILELIEKIDVNMEKFGAQNVSETKIIVNQTKSVPNSIGYMEQLSLKLETFLQSFKTMHQKYDMAVQKSEKLESCLLESKLKLEDFVKNMAKSAKHTKYLHETVQNLEDVNEKIYAENSNMHTTVSDLGASLSAAINEKQRLAKELEARNTTVKVLQQDIAVLEADVANYVDQEKRNAVNLKGICALLNAKATECAEMSNANGAKESVLLEQGALDLDLEKSVHEKQDSDKADYKQITEGVLKNLKADAEKLFLELSSYKHAKIAAENEATELQNKLIQMQQSQSLVNRDKLLRELELLRAESSAAQNEQKNAEKVHQQQMNKLFLQVKEKEEKYSELVEKHKKTMLCINELKAELNSLQLQLQKGSEEKNNLIEESKILINDLESQIKQNEKTLKELQSQELVKDSMQKEISILQAERMELTTKQKQSQNRISNLEKKRGNLEKNNRELNVQLQRHESIETLLNHENGDLNFQIKQLKNCLDQNQIARADLEIQLKQSNERVAELGKVCAANEQLKERLETENEMLNKKMNAEVDTLRAELMSRDAEQKQYYNERYEVEQQREHLAEQVLEISEKLIKMKTEVMEQRKTNKELNDKHQNVVNQLASFTVMEEKLKQECAKSQKLKLDCQILQAKYKETKEELARTEQQVKEQRLELEGKLEKMKAKMIQMQTNIQTQVNDDQASGSSGNSLTAQATTELESNAINNHGKWSFCAYFGRDACLFAGIPLGLLLLAIFVVYVNDINVVLRPNNPKKF